MSSTTENTIDYGDNNSSDFGFAEDTTNDRYLTFVIEDEVYGVEITSIKEIISICAITKVPCTEHYIEGIINLRGEVIPVIDVRKRFGKPSIEYNDLTCIVVIQYASFSLGLIVDNVEEVIHIDESNVLPPPNAKLNHYNQFIRNIGRLTDRVVLLLDLDKLLSQEQY